MAVEGSASSSTLRGQSILSNIQALTQPSLGLPSAYLHPFAPSPGNGGFTLWKGKGKAVSTDSIESQLEVIRAMRLSVEQAKVQLTKREGDWGKLSKALKEVISHQTAMLPLSDTLSPALLRSSNIPRLPSSRISLPPAQLLSALAKSQNMQSFLEDSQFGLLKVTLTLAGKCFVVDIDLETDGAAEEDDTNSANPTPKPTSESSQSAASGDSVRLSKISVSYVAQGGGNGTSQHVARVLKSAVEDYLAEWNTTAEGLLENGLRGKRLERCTSRIEGLLTELKALDGSVQGEDGKKGEEAGFAGLEIMANRIKSLMNDMSAIYPTSHPTICPSFHLFPTEVSHTTYRNPSLRIRPIQPGENVPIPQISKIESSMQNADLKWLLEVIPESDSAGVAVRKNWLGGPSSPGNPWDGGIKVENLLYKPSSHSSSTPPTTVNPFPYQSTFMHRQSEGGSLDQHWSLASPGPDGYIFGRLGLPEADDQLLQVLKALRRQIQLNRMFQGVFAAQYLIDPEDLDSSMEEDDDMEDLLAAPSAIPISVTQTLDHIILESPIPYSDTSGVLLRLTGSPESEDPSLISIACEVLGEGADQKLRETVQGAVQAGEKHADLSRIFRDIEQSIKMHRQ